MNLVYAWCVERVEKREEWEAMLTAALPGHENEVTPFQAEDEGADFMATMAMHAARTAV